MEKCGPECDLYPIGDHCLECRHYWHMAAMGDAIKGVAASGMGFDHARREKMGFEPVTGMGIFIQLCVSEALSIHGIKHQ